jgi:hypothetical protein
LGEFLSFADFGNKNGGDIFHGKIHGISMG